MIKKIIMMCIVFNVQGADNSDTMNPAQSWVEAVQQSTQQKKLQQISCKLPRQLPRELRKKRLPKKK